jgi:hypothetical protein
VVERVVSRCVRIDRMRLRPAALFVEGRWRWEETKLQVICGVSACNERMMVVRIESYELHHPMMKMCVVITKSE